MAHNRRLCSRSDLRVGMAMASLLCVVPFASAHVAVARADTGTDLAVLQETSADLPRDFVETLDARVRDVLATAAGEREIYVSPVDYDEVQLAVGCGDESVSCLTAIARTVQASAVVVRTLMQDERGDVHLRLLYFDPATGQAPATGEVAATFDQRERLVQATPAVIERLLGVRRVPSAEQPPAPSTVHLAANTETRTGAVDAAVPSESRVAPSTWILLATGAALLAPGIVLGVAASADYDEFRRTEVTTRAEVDRAHRDFDSIETRATWSRVLIPAGALAMGVGGVLLGLDLTTHDGAQDSGVEHGGAARPFVAVVQRGGLLGVQGRLD